MSRAGEAGDRGAVRAMPARSDAETHAGPWPLPPRAARTFYNVADAWLPDRTAERDVVAALACGGLEPAACARLTRDLCWLEWSPRLLLHSTRSLSWLPRDARRAWLDRVARRGPFRRAAVRVHRAILKAGG